MPLLHKNLEEAQHLKQGDAKAHFMQCLQLQRSGSFADIDKFKEALKLDPNIPGTYFAIGSSLLSRVGVPNAIAAFEEELKTAPIYHTLCYLNIGHLKIRSGEKDAAKQNFAKARDITSSEEFQHSPLLTDEGKDFVRKIIYVSEIEDLIILLHLQRNDSVESALEVVNCTMSSTRVNNAYIELNLMCKYMEQRHTPMKEKVDSTAQTDMPIELGGAVKETEEDQES